MATVWTPTILDREQSLGSYRAVAVSLAGAAGGYTTGGDAIDLGAVCGLQTVYMALLDEATNGTNAVGAVYDYTNKKLKCFATGSGAGNPHAEITAATSLASYVCRVIVFGI